MSGTEWQDTPSVDASGAASVGGTEWQDAPSGTQVELLPWAELNDLKLAVRESDYLVHSGFSQQIDISLEYPSRM